MKRLLKLMILVFITTSAQAEVRTPITFINNTQYPIVIMENFLTGFNCPTAPGCIDTQPFITIQPNAKGSINLIKVAGAELGYGGVGFSIDVQDPNLNLQDSSINKKIIYANVKSKSKQMLEDTLRVVIPVMTSPAGAFALINFCNTLICYVGDANSQNVIVGMNKMPAYVAAVAQNVQQDREPPYYNNIVAQDTVVSISPLNNNNI